MTPLYLAMGHTVFFPQKKIDRRRMEGFTASFLVNRNAGTRQKLVISSHNDQMYISKDTEFVHMSYRVSEYYTVGQNPTRPNSPALNGWSSSIRQICFILPFFVFPQNLIKLDNVLRAWVLQHHQVSPKSDEKQKSFIYNTLIGIVRPSERQVNLAKDRINSVQLLGLQH